ncbi:hypothetical protein ACH0BU_15815 [Sphingomonas olei]
MDGNTVQTVQLADDIPVAPEWLSAGGKDVWAGDLARVVACGAREPDSHFYAVYCEMMARFVAGVKAGEPLNAAFVSELRKQMEMLSIAGAKARLARGGEKAASTNPFAKFQ